MSETIDELYTKIDRNFPDAKEKCALICTLLGTSANLTEFVMAQHNPAEIPLHLQYCILITSANMISMLGDGAVFQKVDLGADDDWKLSEQGQEHIYRKMKRAIDIIVEEFKNHEAEYGL
jgi:hypothetical protein